VRDMRMLGMKKARMVLSGKVRRGRGLDDIIGAEVEGLMVWE